MKLSDFKVLTFDTYGTLIDWESGIYNALQPLLDKIPIKLDRDEVLELFAEFEIAQQRATPTLVYRDLLTEVARSIATIGKSGSATTRHASSAARSSTGRNLPTRRHRSTTCAGTTAWRR